MIQRKNNSTCQRARYSWAIVKKQLGLDLSLYKILQILSVTVFEKTPILEGFSNFSDEITDAEPCIQLNLFDF